MSEEPFGALLKIKEIKIKGIKNKRIKNKVIKKGKNDEEGDMEGVDSDCNHSSDRH